LDTREEFTYPGILSKARIQEARDIESMKKTESTPEVLKELDIETDNNQNQIPDKLESPEEVQTVDETISENTEPKPKQSQLEDYGA
jgi:hypothetical protein